MINIERPTESRKLFGEIKYGQVFKRPGSMNAYYYQKILPVSDGHLHTASNLETGAQSQFSSDAEVIPVTLRAEEA